MHDFLRSLGNPFAGDTAGTVVLVLVILAVAVARMI
jgi:hypothetical protein